MSKVTARHAQKRAEKKAGRKAERLAIKNKPRDVKAREREAREKKQDLAFYGSGAYQFWLCHGANYLNSDYGTGKWEPIYPDIYQGKLAANVNDIFPLIGEMFFPGGKSIGLKGPRILSWLMAGVRMVRNVSRKLAGYTDSPKEPHQPKVWEFFHVLEDNIKEMLKQEPEMTPAEAKAVSNGGPWPSRLPFPPEPSDVEGMPNGAPIKLELD